MTYIEQARRILEAMQNSKIPFGFREINRDKLEKAIADEIKEIDKEKMQLASER